MPRCVSDQHSPSSPYGKILRAFNACGPVRFLTTQHERDTETGYDNRGARLYDAEIGRFLSVDPLAQEFGAWSSYNYVLGNPVMFIDPDGRKADDFVQRVDGSIYWDDNANDAGSTKSGEKYLGKELNFVFNSFIDGDLWDGPGGQMPAGDKLTSYITISATEDSDGKLLSLFSDAHYEIGPTPVGVGRNYFPGLGDDQNFSSQISVANANGGIDWQFSYEQHASVSWQEHAGLVLMGYDIVNVAQGLTIGVNQGQMSIVAETDIFPSATLTVNGSELFKYAQPSFKGPHGLVESRRTTSPLTYGHRALLLSIDLFDHLLVSILGIEIK